MSNDSANQPFSPSLELLIDYVEGVTSADSSQRIAAYLEVNEEAQAITEGIAFFFEENGHNRDALERWLEEAGLKAEPASPEEHDSVATEFDAEPDNVHQMEQPAKRTSTRWLMAASIAALIGLATLSTLFNSKSSHTLVSEHLETPYEVAQIWRDAEKSEWNTLVQLYDSGHYASFIRDCTVYIEQPDAEPAAPLMLGLAHMYRENFAAATPFLQDAASQTNRLQSTAQWFLALDYIRLNQQEQARPLLEALSKQPASGKQEAALELLEAL